jgi:hypothetical protein
MNGYYNPIVRTFGLCRRVLMEATGLPRQCFRPDTRLDDLLPAHLAGEVFAALRRAGLRPPAVMTLSTALGCLALFVAGPGLVGWGMGGPWTGLAAAASALLFPAFLLIVSLIPATRRAGVRPDGGMTLGELAVHCTSYREHKASGYRWSRGDIALKVRLIVADHAGAPLSRVREETRFVDDLGLD